MFKGGKGAGPATSALAPPVRLDRQLWLLTLVASVLFLWPLLAYGRPGYIQDSASYYKGGRVAVGFVFEKLHLASSPGAAVSPATPGAAPSVTEKTGGADVKGARSVPYSVAAYVLGAPDAKLLLLCGFQALLTGFLCALTLLLFGRSGMPRWRAIALLPFATPVAFVVCVAIPDIFSALIILAVTLLTTAHAQMSRGAVTLCVLIAVAGVAFHSSNVPIALAMTALGVGWLGWQAWRHAPVAKSHWAAVLAPMLFGVLITALANAVAFGGASLTGKRYPLTLARSIAEGPGKWYLDQNCPQLKLAVCELYPDGVPSTISAFLWEKNGLKERASPEQMDRIRAEEAKIVLAATLAYPWQEVERIGSNVALQLVRFEPGVGVLNNRLALDGEGQPVFETGSYNHFWTNLVFWLTTLSLPLWLILLARRFHADPGARPVIVMIVAGILVNAFVCVYFSGLTDRYNARVIWLLPLLALAYYPKNEAAAVQAA